MREAAAKEIEDQAWEAARKLVRGAGDISRSFTLCVRSFFQEGRTAPGSKFTFMTGQHLNRLLASPSVVAHLYFAALTYRPKQLEELKEYTPRQLVELFSPPELAALLMTVYMQRRVGRWLSDEDREPLYFKLQLYLDLAVPLGDAIPSLGAMRCILVGAGRHLGWALLALHDPKALRRYRIGTKVSGKPFDIKEEMLQWGTTHVHIAATLFQMFGFGVQTARGYRDAMLIPAGQSLDDEALRFRVATQWLDALILTGDVPSESLGDDFLLSEDHTETLIERVQGLLDSGSSVSWLNKRRSDIGPEKTPALKYKVPTDVLRKSRRGKKREEADLDEEMEESESKPA